MSAQKSKQLSLIKTHWKHSHCHGGSLRCLARGRKARPLSTKHYLHLVFKINAGSVRSGLRAYKAQSIIHRLIKKYGLKFHVKIDSYSIQRDHIHLIIRTSRRSLYQSYFRVLAGQIAQVFQREGLMVTDTPKISSSTTKLQSEPKSKLMLKPCSEAKLKLMPQNQMEGSPSSQPQSRPRPLKLWKYRPFSRVIKGYRAFRTVQDYVRLNELEVRGGD